MVEAGVGIGIVSETTARRAERSMAIAVVPLADDGARRDLRTCRRSRQKLSPAARRLVDHLSAP